MSELPDLPKDGPLIETFDQAGLSNDLLKGIVGYGYEKPAEVQKKALRTILHSTRNFEVISAAGTGKTALSIMCALHKIDFSSRDLQVVSIVPTREIAHANAAVSCLAFLFSIISLFWRVFFSHLQVLPGYILLVNF